MALPKGNSATKVEETADKVVNISKALCKGLEVWGNGAYHHTSNEQYDSDTSKLSEGPTQFSETFWSIINIMEKQCSDQVTRKKAIYRASNLCDRIAHRQARKHKLKESEERSERL